MSWLTNLVPEPHTRINLTPFTFARDFLPPFVFYSIYAYLIQFPDTRRTRLALLPVSLWTTFNGATRIDLSMDKPAFAYLNQGLVLAFTTSAMRITAWCFVKAPFKRLHHSHLPSSKAQGKGNTQSNRHSKPLNPMHKGSKLWDTLDLMFNFRGLGWDWSNGLQVPHDTRPTHSKPLFFLHTLISFLIHLVAFDLFHYSVQWFSPSTIGAPLGGTIFDHTLPPLHRYARSTLIGALSGLTVYSAITAAYLLFTLVGITLLGQHPSQWPPVFDSPWRSTSLTDFWAKRWHQIFRDNFISVGAYPLSLLIGRVGGVLGAFFISGVLHNFGLWGMGRGAEFSSMGGYFLVMGVGLILEGVWKKIMAKPVVVSTTTERSGDESSSDAFVNGSNNHRHSAGNHARTKYVGGKVGGAWGWIWTMAWVVGWAYLLVDAWARKGLVGSQFFPTGMRPSDYIVGPLDRSA
ncbi:hypothetical protein AX16_010155 [Volvariella volvacea WC 439]|nr:hypothetical protein AX16_010155 [Volvariella volvacea WC 439]